MSSHVMKFDSFIVYQSFHDCADLCLPALMVKVQL